MHTALDLMITTGHQCEDSRTETVADSTHINAWFPLRGQVDPITPVKPSFLQNDNNQKPIQMTMMSLSQSTSDDSTNVSNLCAVSESEEHRKIGHLPRFAAVDSLEAKKNKKKWKQKMQKKKSQKRAKSDGDKKSKRKKKRK